MKLRTVILPVLAAALLSLTSCMGTLNRAGKDATVFVSSPILVPMAAAADAYTSAVEVRKGYGGNALTQVASYPVLFVWHGVKHLVWAPVVHGADLVLTPFYGLAESGGVLDDVQPIDYYQFPNTWFDSNSSGTDAETGENDGR